jgi:outer membrane protein OmpA-like peptidoglycan-associated protein
MNQLYRFCTLSLLILLPGCGWYGKKMTKNDPVKMPINKNGKTTQVSFFDEDVEAFVLEEEPTMLASTEKSVKKTDFTWDDTKEAFDSKLDTICFDYDSAQIKKEERSKLVNSLKKAEKEKGKTVVCKGHACKWHGTRVYNFALSEQRAQQIAKEFNDRGIKTKVFGVGTEESIENLPMTKNGQAPNRRVEIYTVTA